MIIPQRIGKAALPNFYQKLTTEGDIDRFTGAAQGSREIVTFETGNTAIFDEGSGDYLVTLTVPYLVGTNQLWVFHSYQAEPLTPLFTSEEIADYSLPSTLYSFEEVDSYTVRIKAAGITRSADNRFLFLIPHTSVPISIREKIIVRDQGDNRAIEFEGDGDGLLMKSPNGAKWLIRVDDSGNIVAESR
jgi:hypothetical protein